MNRILVILALILAANCKEAPKSNKKESEIIEEVTTKEAKIYPVELNRVFEAHGSLATWQTMRTLSFTMPKPEGDEKHTIDLRTRREKIATDNVSMGYDGKDFWLVDEKETYTGDPLFYHNLMFYFYSMPFVLADDGINYDKAEDLEFDGKSYPGIRISYNDGVGESSKDEYYLHYDTDSNHIAWLGYTVTYRSGAKSDSVKWIRYNDRQDVNGLILPKSLTWYNVKEGRPREAASTVNFDAVTVTDIANSAAFFGVPANAKIVTKH